MEGVRESDVKCTWELISQFVCWEFCRNVDFEGDIADVQNQTDLLQFFRDMVIKMTTKQYESDITPHEIAAKFIEELSVIASSPKPAERLSYVVKLSETLKKLCPELKPAIKEVLSSIYPKLFTLEDRGLLIMMEDEEVRQSIKAFFMEVYKHLPLPELIKATSAWKKSPQSSNSDAEKISEDVVISWLKKQKLTRQEIMKIKTNIEEDILLKMYFDEVSYTGPGLEDFPEDVTETNKRPASSKKPPQKKNKQKSTGEPSSKKGLSLDDYFTVETHEIGETPVEDLDNQNRPDKGTRQCASTSDEPQVILEKLSDQRLHGIQVGVGRIDHRTSANKTVCIEDTDCEMAVVVDQIKKEKSPHK